MTEENVKVRSAKCTICYTKNIMSNKPKKKRTKVYTGVDASLARPVVTKIAAADRGKLSQWWFDHKRIARPVLITSGIVIVAIWLIVELVRTFTR
jgi:hypothetical protein